MQGLRKEFVYTVLLLSFFLVSCDTKEPRAPHTTPPFFNLLGQYEEKKRFEKDGVHLFLNFPYCYQEERYNWVTITNEFNFSCKSPHHYFAFDILSDGELYRYKAKNKSPDSSALFPNEKSGILSTVVNKRLKTLNGGIHAEISPLLLNDNKLKFSTVICEGTNENNYQVLTYYYAYIPIKKSHVLFQFICESEHFYSLLPDFNRLLSSLKYS